MNSELHNYEFFLWKNCHQEKCFCFFFSLFFSLADHIKKNVIKTDSALLQQGNTIRKHFDRKTKRETTKNQQLLEVTFYVTTDLTEIEETK